MWGGEFGRTPFREGRTAKRRLVAIIIRTSTLSGWPAVEPSLAPMAPATSWASGAEDKVHVHDLQATILHLMGMDHEKLYYRFKAANIASPMCTAKW